MHFLYRNGFGVLFDNLLVSWPIYCVMVPGYAFFTFILIAIRFPDVILLRVDVLLNSMPMMHRKKHFVYISLYNI